MQMHKKPIPIEIGHCARISTLGPPGDLAGRDLNGSGLQLRDERRI